MIGDLEALLAPISSPVAGATDGALGIIPDVGGAMGMALLQASGVTERQDRGRARAYLMGSAVEPGEMAGVATFALVAVVVNRVVRAALAPALAPRRGLQGTTR